MNRVTIVTGGGRGIGAATCRSLVRAGHRLLIGYRVDADAADRLAAEIRASGGQAVAAALPTTDTDAVRRAFDQAEAVLGQVTGLVNNAGVTSPIGTRADTSDTDLRQVIEVNVLGYLYCAREAARRLTRGGAIVNVSSAAATLGSPGEYVHYAASKAAVDTLTVGLAKELGPAGIRVNTVSPGIIRTALHELSGDPGRVDRVGGASPLGRPGEPAEVAAAIAWLLSDEASYTTGANLRVAGGR